MGGGGGIGGDMDDCLVSVENADGRLPKLAKSYGLLAGGGGGGGAC